MYYEEAVVKEYSRKDGRNTKQINLGVNSKFTKKNNKVIVISSESIQTFKEGLEPKTKELELTVERLRTENDKLKNTIDELNREHKQEIKEKDSEIKEKNTEIKELNSKLINEKDTSKTLLLALYSYEERGIINGFFNRTPPLAKQILKENPKPIETNKKE